MKVTKSLLLGAAAGLVAMSGAQAADLPVKAKAVEYVKICSAYGAGFYYIPGTDICLRVGGFVRADYAHNNPGTFIDIAYGDPGAQSTTNVGNGRFEETHTFRGRGGWILDARNDTAYGTLRAFLNGYISFTTSAAGGAGPDVLGADRAFIQWAGFTFGRAASFYDFFASSGPQANLVNWGGQTTGASGWNVLAYTAQFGNGISATLSIEDQRRKPIYEAVALGSDLNTASAASATAPTSVRAGQNLPALVANWRVDQSWGSAQLMGAVQELRTVGTNEISALPTAKSTWGYAVGGGFTWNNPSAPGSQFGIQASWAVGAVGYVQTGHSSTVHGVLDGGTPDLVAYGHVADAIWDVSNDRLYKTEAWGVNAGYQHRFNPQWAWSLHGAYTSINYPGGAEVATTGAGGSLDFDVWSLGTRILWTPVTGLNFGLDFLYHRFGTMEYTPGVVKTITADDNDVASVMFRVQRDF